MEKNKSSLSQDTQNEQIPQAELPVNPAQPDPEDHYDEVQPINWKERLYDRIPDKKKALKFLDFLIPALFALIALVVILGMLK